MVEEYGPRIMLMEKELPSHLLYRLAKSSMHPLLDAYSPPRFILLLALANVI
jgi:hypothetical protein